MRGFACAGCQYFSGIDHPFGASVAELCVMPVNSVDSERILVFKSPVNLGTGVPAPGMLSSCILEALNSIDDIYRG